MNISFTTQFELRKATKRWQWCFWTAYLNAGFTAVTAFVVEDEHGKKMFGFDPLSSPLILGYAIVLGGLAWGIHRRFSMICLTILLALVLIGAVVLAQDDNPKDAIGNCVVAFFLFRGIMGVRQLKHALKESKCPLINYLARRHHHCNTGERGSQRKNGG